MQTNLKPGYFNKKPLLKVVSEVKSTIGLQDSCIQTNEVAIRYLESISSGSGDQSEFIKGLCKTYAVSAGIDDFEYFKTIQYKSYILQTYNLVEPFFKALNSSYRFYNNFTGNWKTRDGDKNLDPFNQLLENLTSTDSKAIKAYPEYYLLNYYRLVRNSIVHLQEDPEQHKQTQKYFEQHIADKMDFFRRNYELEAPNVPDSISFNDFMLYTRAIKYFSNILNDVCFPTVESLVYLAETDDILSKRLAQSNNIAREGTLLKRVNTLRRFFHGHFNTSHKELRDEFCKAFLSKEGIDYHDILK
jgi:hypothetical protein